MWRSSFRILRAVSPVVVRTGLGVADMKATRGNELIPVTKLHSKKYNTVDDKNRFLPLRLVLKMACGHYGRRQLPLNIDLLPVGEDLESVGLDWFDVKGKSPKALRQLCAELRLPPSLKCAFLAVVDSNVCGVVKERGAGEATFSVCTSPGLDEHGGRCGQKGHINGVYFEGKEVDVDAHTSLTAVREGTLRERSSDGAELQHRDQPDFSVVGRMQADYRPRVWASPSPDPVFDVMCIGYEFFVHPEDPRAVPQIVNAKDEWALHADVVKHVIWEMLEANAVERTSQHLEVRVGDVEPEPPNCFFPVTFTSETGQRVDVRMRTSDGNSVPWFREPPPQPFTSDGLPEHIPISPTIVVRSRYHLPATHRGSNVDELQCPQLKIDCLSHAESCFWMPDESQAVEHILSFAKSVPYSLPFNLYFRVDTTRSFRANPTLLEQRQSMYDANKQAFDLKTFCSRQRGAEDVPQ